MNANAATPREPLLVAHEIRVTVGQRPLLWNVSIELFPGEILGLLGPNGAGKSTLLRVLAVVLTPQAGTVRLRGRALSEWPPTELAKHRAVLSQHHEIAFGFTAWEVALLGRLPYHHGTPSARDRAIVCQALERMNATALAPRPYLSLSGGERTRIQLARVLAQVWHEPPQPAVLLLDEPTAALDLAHALQLLQQLRALAESGFAVIVVLHDLNLAAVLCDRVALIKDGMLRYLGRPRELFKPSILLDVFSLRCSVSERFDRPIVHFLLPHEVTP